MTHNSVESATNNSETYNRARVLTKHAWNHWWRKRLFRCWVLGSNGTEKCHKEIGLLTSAVIEGLFASPESPTPGHFLENPRLQELSRETASVANSCIRGGICPRNSAEFWGGQV